MHTDLLAQAKALARADRGRPKQVNLRRAISAAYYGLFHYLIDEACRAILGTRNEYRNYRDALARAFNHATMRKACESFASGTLPKSVLKTVPSLSVIPADLRLVAAEFVDAQEERHSADYARAKRFKRSEADAIIGQVESAILRFESMPDRQLRKFFLVCLLTWENIRRN